METLCAKTLQPSGPSSGGASSTVIETEKEVSIQNYSSQADKEFSKLETKDNLLREILFNEYMYSLVIFSVTNATLQDDYSKRPPKFSSHDPFFTEELSPEMFQSFIENKIFKHPSLYVKAGENESLASLFKESLLFIHKSLLSKLDQNDKNNGANKPKNEFRKMHALAIGLLYCVGTNVSKIRILFDLFSDGGRLGKSSNLHEFLIALFLIPSYCMLYSRNKLSGREDLGEFPKETMKQLLDCCELKDSVNLVTVTEKMLFPIDGKSYSYEEFKALFELKTDASLGWLISPKGIRHMLEKNNV